jgi:hypothetical protein
MGICGGFKAVAPLRGMVRPRGRKDGQARGLKDGQARGLKDGQARGLKELHILESPHKGPSDHLNNSP